VAGVVLTIVGVALLPVSRSLHFAAVAPPLPWCGDRGSDRTADPVLMRREVIDHVERSRTHSADA
jgi:hypothetical protein